MNDHSQQTEPHQSIPTTSLESAVEQLSAMAKRAVTEHQAMRAQQEAEKADLAAALTESHSLLERAGRLIRDFQQFTVEITRVMGKVRSLLKVRGDEAALQEENISPATPEPGQLSHADDVGSTLRVRQEIVSATAEQTQVDVVNPASLNSDSEDINNNGGNGAAEIFASEINPLPQTQTKILTRLEAEQALRAFVADKSKGSAYNILAGVRKFIKDYMRTENLTDVNAALNNANVMTAYEKWLKAGGYSDSTVKNYLTSLSSFRRHLNGVPPRKRNAPVSMAAPAASSVTTVTTQNDRLDRQPNDRGDHQNPPMSIPNYFRVKLTDERGQSRKVQDAIELTANAYGMKTDAIIGFLKRAGDLDSEGRLRAVKPATAIDLPDGTVLKRTNTSLALRINEDSTSVVMEAQRPLPSVASLSEGQLLQYDYKPNEDSRGARRFSSFDEVKLLAGDVDSLSAEQANYLAALVQLLATHREEISTGTVSSNTVFRQEYRRKIESIQNCDSSLGRLAVFQRGGGPGEVVGSNQASVIFSKEFVKRYNSGELIQWLACYRKARSQIAQNRLTAEANKLG